MIRSITVLLISTSVGAQYYGSYLDSRGPRIGTYGMGMNMDPYRMGIMNPYEIGGKVFDPYLADACVDVNMQCPVWASTGQCVTNPLVMRYQCKLSCGVCTVGSIYGPRNYGNALGPMYDGLGLGVLGYNPLPGIRKYDKGILRASSKSSIYPSSEKKD